MLVSMLCIQNAFMLVTLNCSSCREAYLISYNFACLHQVYSMCIVTAGYVSTAISMHSNPQQRMHDACIDMR